MSQEKYIGMDVHQATISVAVMDAGGKLIMECLLEPEDHRQPVSPDAIFLRACGVRPPDVPR